MPLEDVAIEVAPYTTAMKLKSVHFRGSWILVRRSVRLPMLSLALLTAPAALLVSAPIASAQRATVARTVDGTVTSGGGPVKGAVVHLKDTRSLSQKSYITAEDGSYRFGQLSSNTDYDVWAESGGKKSSVKSISSFDSKNAFTIALKINE